MFSKFVKPSVLVESLKSLDTLFTLQYGDHANQVASSDLVVGFLTKQKINKLLHNGDISAHQNSSFHEGVRKFL